MFLECLPADHNPVFNQTMVYDTIYSLETTVQQTNHLFEKQGRIILFFYIRYVSEEIVSHQ